MSISDLSELDSIKNVRKQQQNAVWKIQRGFVSEDGEKSGLYKIIVKVIRF